jgi:hypothetical protein
MPDTLRGRMKHLLDTSLLRDHGKTFPRQDYVLPSIALPLCFTSLAFTSS